MGGGFVFFFFFYHCLLVASFSKSSLFRIHLIGLDALAGTELCIYPDLGQLHKSTGLCLNCPSQQVNHDEDGKYTIHKKFKILCILFHRFLDREAVVLW